MGLFMNYKLSSIKFPLLFLTLITLIGISLMYLIFSNAGPINTNDDASLLAEQFVGMTVPIGLLSLIGLIWVGYSFAKQNHTGIKESAIITFLSAIFIGTISAITQFIFIFPQSARLFNDYSVELDTIIGSWFFPVMAGINSLPIIGSFGGPILFLVSVLFLGGLGGWIAKSKQQNQ